MHCDNDASTDNSGDVCKEYAERDRRIRYIDRGINQGLSVVRNKTIEDEKKGPDCEI